MAFNITKKDVMSKQKCIEHSKAPLKKNLKFAITCSKSDYSK